MKTSTYHSECATLKSVYLKSCKVAFASEHIIESQWASLNYFSKPNFELAVKEYANFELIFKKNNVDIHYFPSNEKEKIDAIYCRDASIATDFGMIICNMGKQGRIIEPKTHFMEYEKKKIGVLGVIKSPGTLEGGDVAWLDSKTLAVGLTYRTNIEGIKQLKALLEPKGVRVLVVDLPHYKGQNDVFHLMSVLSPVAKDLAVVYSPLIPIRFRNELLEMGYKFVEVPEEEFNLMGCNVLAISERNCIMVDGNPVTKKLLELAGCKVTTYIGNEICVKGGGGPTCLTRPMLRIQ